VKTILAIFLTILLLLPVSAFGEIQTVTHNHITLKMHLPI
jgi:hypothetical protein